MPASDRPLLSAEDQHVLDTFKRSKTWRRVMEVLEWRRDYLFTELGKQADPHAIAKAAGRIDEVNHLLNGLPWFMLRYEQFKRGEQTLPDDESPASESAGRSPGRYSPDSEIP